MTPDELLVPSFQQNVKPRVASIYVHKSVSGTRRRHAYVVKQITRQRLAEITGVLYRVVKVNLLQAVKRLSVGELVEIERERRFVVDIAIRKRALQVQRHIGVFPIAFA